MPVLQPIRRAGTRSNAQARNLLNNVFIPASTRYDLNTSTVKDERITQSVMRCLAVQVSLQAGIVILPDEHFYLVRSRLEICRFYVLVRRDRQWQCSSKNEAVAKLCIRQVERYIETSQIGKLLRR